MPPGDPQGYAQPQFVRRDGDVGYFRPAGGGPERAVYLPGAPSFARIVEEADAAQQQVQAQPGGMGASAPIADRGGMVPGPDPELARMLQERQPRPAPSAPMPEGAFDLDAAAQRAAQLESQRAAATVPLPPAAPTTVGGPLQIPVATMDPNLRPLGSPARPVVIGNQRFGAEALSDTADLTGGQGAPVAPGGAPAAGRPGAPMPSPAGRMRPAGRPAAPAAPPTEAQLNEQLVTELTNRPQGDAPIVPGDFRRASFGERTNDLIAGQERLERERAALGGRRAAEEQDVIEDAQRRQMRLERERQDAMRMAQQRYDAAVRRLQESRIDPNRYWADRGGAVGRIGGAIAVALGAAGAAMTGGPNTALQIIQNEINQDIEAQRAGMERDAQGVQAARSFLDITRAEFTDRQAAEDAARAMAWETVARRVAQHEAGLADGEARQRAAALRLQAEQEAAAAAANAQRAELLAELELRERMATVTTAEANAMRATRRARGGGGNPTADLARRAQLARSLQQAGIDPQQAREMVGLGDARAAPATASVPPDIAQRMAAYVQAQRDLDELIPTTGEDIPGVGRIAGRLPTIMQGPEARRLQSRARNLYRRFVRLESGAVIGPDELDDELEARGMYPGASAEEWLEGYRQLTADAQARMRAVQGQLPQVRDGRGEVDAASQAVGFRPDGGS